MKTTSEVERRRILRSVPGKNYIVNDDIQKAKEEAQSSRPSSSLLGDLFIAGANRVLFFNLYKAYGIHYDNAQYDLALKDANGMIRLSPNNGSLYNIRAGLYNDQEKYDLAYNDATTAISLDQNNQERKAGVFDYYYTRGLAAYYLKKYAQCASDMTVVINKDKSYTSAYYYRGASNSQFYTDPIGCINDLTVYIGKFPNPDWVYYHRATNYYTLKQFDKAFSDFDIALKKYPTEIDIIIYRGKSARWLSVLNKTKSPSDSLKYFQIALSAAEKGLELEPNEPGNNLFYGNCMIVKRNWTEALKYINKAIELAGNNQFGALYGSRGFCYYNLKKYKEAIADYEKGVALDKNADKFAYSAYYEDAKKQYAKLLKK